MSAPLRGLTLAAAGLAAVVIPRARRELDSEGRLHRVTSTAGWAGYALHGGMVLLAARERAWPLPLPRHAARATGCALMTAGAAAWTAGARRFTSLATLSGVRNEDLITGGIYRHTRNPQNLGWVLVLAGAAMAGRSGFASVAAGAFWPGIGLYLQAEERHLERTFGERYRRYASSTARWIGPIRRS